MKFPVIITFHEKYGDYKYYAESYREYRAVMASIIRARYEADWYFKPSEPQPYFTGEEKAVLTLKENEITLTSDQDKVLKNAKKKAENAQYEYEANLRTWELIQQVVKCKTVGEAADMVFMRGNRTYYAALQVITDRQYCEYEGFEVESISELQRVEF